MGPGTSRAATEATSAQKLVGDCWLQVDDRKMG